MLRLALRRERRDLHEDRHEREVLSVRVGRRDNVDCEQPDEYPEYDLVELPHDPTVA